ncbi:MAG: hypothetical protein AAGI38_13835 [Bacteroidota bacterium]
MKTPLFYFAAGILMLIGIVASGLMLIGSLVIGLREAKAKRPTFLVDDDPVYLPN